MKRKLVRIVAMVAISMGGVLWASPAFAYGPNGNANPGLCRAQAAHTAAGATPNSNSVFPVTCTGFLPGETVTLVLYSTPVTLGTTTADPQGSFSTTVTIPANTTPGNHTIVATGNTSGRTASTSIVVTSATTTGGTSTGGSSGGGLAFTGAHIAAMAGVGAIALALGGMLVFAGRRRRVTSSHS